MEKLRRFNICTLNLLFFSRSNNANNSIGGGGDSNSAESKNSRRSLRKREGKSYNEDGFDNLIFDDDNSAPGSPIKGANKKTTRQNSTKSNSNNPKMNDNTTGNSNAVNSNGDVEMESEDDSDDDGPLEPLPVPKVRKRISHFLVQQQIFLFCIKSKGKKKVIPTVKVVFGCISLMK